MVRVHLQGRHKVFGQFRGEDFSKLDKGIGVAFKVGLQGRVRNGLFNLTLILKACIVNNDKAESR
jgi:hypothetical protein